ncbi:MAG: hypothetical protein GXY15_10295 [Candidatus Hydrogenedentes bacterium]|nr:hypothetical protein [Candidatus Hydrogenedentota bacterium]
MGGKSVKEPVPRRAAGRGNAARPSPELAAALEQIRGAWFARALELLETPPLADTPDGLYHRALVLVLLNRSGEAFEVCRRLWQTHRDPRARALAGQIRARKEPVAEPAAAPSPPRRVRRLLRRAAAVLAILALGAGVLLFALLGYPFLRHWQEMGAPLLSESPAVSLPVLPAAGESSPAPPPETVPDASPSLGRGVIALLDGKATAPSDGAEEKKPGEWKEGLLGGLRAAMKRSPAAAAEHPAMVEWRARTKGMTPAPMPQGPVASVVELQPNRRAETLENAGGDRATLVNLNPAIGAWHLLETRFGGKTSVLHLELFPLEASLGQRPTPHLWSGGLELELLGERKRFALWTPDPANADRPGVLADTPALSAEITAALQGKSPYHVLCDGMVLLRTPRPGSASAMELATDVLRQHRLGEWFVDAMKPALIDGGEAGDAAAAPAAPSEEDKDAPRAAWLKPADTPPTHLPKALGIATDAGDAPMACGRWYRAVNHPGVHVGIMIPALADDTVLASYPDRVRGAGVADRASAEMANVAYMLAFDLDVHRFGWAAGAEHPSAEWSPLAWAVKQTGPGPDGFKALAPVAPVGAVPPWLADRTVAVFAGGFKRKHGVLNAHPFGKVNNGTHYGFMQQGVVLSRLWPGLASAAILPDGRFDLLTWPAGGESRLTEFLHIRQNGLPLVEGVDAAGVPVPGEYVKDWKGGAWSGNVEGQQLTIRMGMGIQRHGGRSRLLLGYFTGATPNAMARVFQAYHCAYAMHLDMNSRSLCHTALITRDPATGAARAECLLRDMAPAAGAPLRFLQTGDTRDFFYVTREG